MLQSITATKSLCSVNSHKTPDKVLSTLRNLIPVWTIKLILSSHDLSKECRVVFIVKRRVTAQSEDMNYVNGNLSELFVRELEEITINVVK